MKWIDSSEAAFWAGWITGAITIAAVMMFIR
jgi:hypothetical protein